MSKFSQEMFWTPSETVTWIQRVAQELALWVVLWPVGSDARVIGADELTPEMLCDHTEDSLHLFLGSAYISEGPEWREIAGKRQLDFQKSYAVQLVPSLMAPDGKTLLQGRLAILRPDQYDDTSRAKRLASLYRALKNSMAKHSDRSRVVTQVLANGERKTWRDVLVGKAIPGVETLRLKQFSKGDVVFELANG